VEWRGPLTSPEMCFLFGTETCVELYKREARILSSTERPATSVRQQLICHGDQGNSLLTTSLCSLCCQGRHGIAKCSCFQKSNWIYEYLNVCGKIILKLISLRSQNSSMTGLQDIRLRNLGSIPGTSKECFLYNIEKGSGPHPASYTVSTGSSFPCAERGRKVTRL
jgi:hypothetical protein